MLRTFMVYFLLDSSFWITVSIRVVLFFPLSGLSENMVLHQILQNPSPSPSRHNCLKHTTWSSLFNCLISLHSTTDRLFIFIFSMNKSFNNQTLFFSSIDGNTIFLPIWKRKSEDAVSISEVPKCSLLPQFLQSHRNPAISLFIPPPTSLLNSPLRIAQQFQDLV